MRLLWALDHRLRSISKQMQNRLGVTAPQRLALRLVGRTPGLTPSELAGSLHLDRGTVTGIVERLVSRGILQRAPHPEDGRSVVLKLSARGRRLDRETTGTVEECVRRALSKLTPTQIEVAQQVLEAIAHELDVETQRE
ncbi:MAG TPA: MarR family transcriptional regulator [Polyangiaceae bacterium]|nr:MarR family transcriptional regulator [Polyangiaceae bacterium]